MKQIPFLRPSLVKKEAYLEYLSRIDESRYYSNFGPLNSLFEDRVLVDFFGNEGAVTTANNATTALMIAIHLMKRPNATYALMPSFTFAAAPLAAIWCGLKPYFVDIRQDNWCMDEELLEDVLGKLGDDVAVVIPYATFGTYLDLTYYNNLHNSRLPVVVDAAPAFGTTGEDGQLGQKFDGIIVFSLHATKPFGIGEGALLYSNRSEFVTLARQMMNFGFSNNRESMIQGLNGKLSEYAAAIALATIEEFPKKIEKRQNLYKFYFQEFKKAEMFNKGWEMHNTRGKIPYQFISVLHPTELSNVEIVRFLKDHSIESRTYFSPACHQQHIFLKYPRSSMAVTEAVSQRIISLPLWEEMEIDDIQRVVETLTKISGDHGKC